MTVSAIIFLIAFGAGCLLALGKHPIYGLLTYIGNFYVHPPSRWWGQGWMHDVRWAFIAAGVTIVALLIRNHRRPELPLFHHGFMWGMLFFFLWITLQSFWAVDPTQHAALIEYYFKFVVVVALIYYSIDSERHFSWFLWAHVVGCFYFGWIAYSTYTGGRFEGFGGGALTEANAAALTMATGAFFAGSLFLAGGVKSKVVLVGLAAFIVNGVVTTISRSAFLAMAVGGIVFNMFTPRDMQGR